MHFFIHSFKISNFLSFFGEYEVHLKPFSAIMCNYYEGKDDLLRSLEFVFGAKLHDLRVDNVLDLVHKVLREEFLINSDIQCYVEVMVNLVEEQKQLKFRRSLKNGSNVIRIEHKISDVITSNLLYEEKLNSLGLSIRRKNLIFYKSYFDNVIWGSSEDLEMTISTCLRETCIVEDWKKAHKKMEHLTKSKRFASEKNYNSMKRSQHVIEKYVNKFEEVLFNRENIRRETLKHSTKEYSEENSLDISKEPRIDFMTDKTENLIRVNNLQAKNDLLTKKLRSLKLKESVLTGQLYHEEIKLGVKSVNASILQNRIAELKNKIREKEKHLSEIWFKILETKSKVENLSEHISFGLLSLREIQIRVFHQNRFTSNGRFHDYLQPSRYLKLLKQIIGPEIFYAHLCDSFEDALFAMNLLNVFKYENREVFIIFDHYSHKLKDVLTASGEKGVQLNTLEQLLIFLCKLKHYGLIDEVPVIAQKQFHYEDPFPEDFVIYPRNGLKFTSDGLISYMSDGGLLLEETETELQNKLLQLQMKEETLYQEWNDLLYLRLEILFSMDSLENDVSYLKQKWKKSTRKSLAVSEPPQPSEIYSEYANFFSQHDEERQKFERELLQEESFFSDIRPAILSYSSGSSNESLSSITGDLKQVIVEITEIEDELYASTKELRLLLIGPFYRITIQTCLQRYHHNFDKSKHFFEKEFRKLKKLMNENVNINYDSEDFYDFTGSREWRAALLNSLTKDFNDIKNKLKTSKEAFQSVRAKRKGKLYPLIEHLSQHLSSCFTHLVDDALPFIDLNFGTGEEKLELNSCMGEDRINVVDIKHFNTFLRFISALSVFLELANYEKIPLMVLDNVEEYFPLHDDNLEAVMNFNTLENIIPDIHNPRFHLLMRVGQFLAYYLKKAKVPSPKTALSLITDIFFHLQNTPGNHVRNNESDTDYSNGPMQILYFVTEDFIHAANHFIWIHHQILPEEFIADDCDSYSEIHTIEIDDSLNWCHSK